MRSFYKHFFKAYALAAAKCDDFPQARIFHDLMTGVLDELKLHESCSATLGVDLDVVEPYVETAAYTDFLLRVAWHGNLAEIIAAMVPCMRVYQYLGTEVAASLRPDHPYEQWIKTYSGADFGRHCARVESLVDEIASNSPAVHDAYRYAMQCELDFFSAPLENTP